MYRNFGKAVIRTPLFSYDDLIPLTVGDLFSFERLITEKLNDSLFMESLYWASPDLYLLAIELKNGHIGVGKKKDRLLHSLKKYIIRAGSRPTPYGIFAGCDLTVITGDPSPDTNKADALLSFRRKVRPDMALLINLSTQLKEKPSVWPLLKYRTNTSLYFVQGSYRYQEYQKKTGGEKDFHLSAIAHSPVLEKIFSAASTQLLGLKEIFDLIGEDSDEEEKFSFVEELIRMQFLTSELEIDLTEGDQLAKLKSQLIRLSALNAEIDKYIALIEGLEAAVLTLENTPLGILPVESIDHVKHLLADLDIPLTKGILFQVDLLRPDETGIGLSDKTVEELLDALSVLSMFSSGTSYTEEHLKQFKKAFTEKYETQEIPFSEVCDAEVGIGFPVVESIGNTSFNSFTQGLKKSSDLKKETHKYKWHDFLEERANKVDSSNRDGIRLKSGELLPFQDKRSQLSNTISLLFSVLPDGQLLLHNNGGATANSLLGRFAYLTKEMNDLSLCIADQDEQFFKDDVLAEIVHLPEGRVGNVIQRPRFSKYEIPFLGNSGLAFEDQIGLEDLMISVHYDEIVLRSKRLNKKIIPRLSCAHNYSVSQLGTYQFLGALQHQKKQGFQISWGEWARGRIFLPRVSYRNVILQLASWSFRPIDYAVVLADPLPVKALIAFLKHWNVPRYFAMSDADNDLFFDREEDDYLMILLEELRKKQPLRIVEWLHFSENASPDKKHFVNQFILPLYRDNVTRGDEHQCPETQVIKRTENASVSRIFPPGSEWVYFKIYCGAHGSDTLLSEVCAPLVKRALKEQLIDQFFFIRYTDPNYHIRFRLHVTKAYFAGEILKRVYEALIPHIANRSVWKVQLDTYQRELERYGWENIGATEYLYFEDAMLYLRLLREEDFLTDERLRLFAALKSIDKWLTLFGLKPEEKISFTTQMARVFIKEFGDESKSKVDLQYREMKDDLIDFMKSNRFDRLLSKRGKKTVTKLAPENLVSYIHMSINRWFKTDQRLMEYICYVFCAKYYKSCFRHLLT